jgi:large subunit ribosomal protein L18
MEQARTRTNRNLRKLRIQSRVKGNAARPRLSVSVSNRHVSAQIIDDTSHRTIAASSTVGTKQTQTMTEQAMWIGEDIAKKAIKQKVKRVVFDRNGRKYHGRLAALADAARKQGLEF